MSRRAERDIRNSQARQRRRAHHPRPLDRQVETNQRGRALANALLAAHRAHREQKRNITDDG